MSAPVGCRESGGPGRTVRWLRQSSRPEDGALRNSPSHSPSRSTRPVRMRTRYRAALAALAGLLIAVPASSHHSTVEFDYTKAYAVVGTVKELQWTNPHSWLQVLVPDESGELVEWGFELGAPVFNVRMGWSNDSLVRGDEVIVVFCPTKKARPRGTLMFVYREGQPTLNGVAANFFRGERQDDPLAYPRPPALPDDAE